MVQNNQQSDDVAKIDERLRKLETRFTQIMTAAAVIGVVALASGAYTKYALNQVSDLASQTSTLGETVGGIDGTVNQAIDRIEKAQTTAETAISAAFDAATTSIGEQETSAKDDIASIRSTVLDEVQAAVRSALNDIGSARSSALDEIKVGAGKAVKQASESEWDIVLSQLDEAGTTLKSAIVAFDLASGCPTEAGWVEYRETAGRFLVGVGQNQDRNGEARSFDLGAGSNDGEYRHTLTPQEIPYHQHTLKYGELNVQQQGRPTWIPGVAPLAAGHHTPGKEYAIDQNNIRNPHNNMPPYIALYFCKYDGVG